jgi:DNA-binding XRE family transcriptional regulator
VLRLFMDEKSKRSAYISKKIIALRNSAGWSQSELARKIHVTSAAISQIEKGNRLPSFDVCRKLAEVFNISIDDLTGVENLSTGEINADALAFYRQFGDIKKLSASEQNLLKKLIEIFKDKK